MTGEAAISRVAGEQREIAKVLCAGDAIRAMPAAMPQPRNAYSLAKPRL
jgi:hypothetical protein